MRALSVIAAILFLCACVSAFAADQTGDPSNGRKFGVYYGTRDFPALSSFDVLVLDADRHPNLALIRQHASVRQTLLGYVSLCELGPGRRYAEALLRSGLILPHEMQWRGSALIDIRRREWQRMVVEEIVPQVFEDGFDGLFLDTLDDAVWLRDDDGKPFPGMQDAAVALVHAIRASIPGRPIMMNRGFELLAQVGGDIDMVLAESLMSNWKGLRHQPRLMPRESFEAPLEMIAAARRQHSQLAVYSLEYWDPKDQVGVARLYSLARLQGFIPYVATPTLKEIVWEPPN